MSVSGIDHINISVTDLDDAADYYSYLLGLTAGPALNDMPLDTYRWMRDKNGQAVIHLRRKHPDEGLTGAFDHVAFNCHGRDSFEERLKSLNMEYRLYENEEAGISLIQSRDKHGLLLEMNFKAD